MIPRGRRGARLEAIRAPVRYGGVGAVNVAIYYAAYLGAQPETGYLAAHLLGLAGAMISSFFLHCRVTFRVRPTWRRALAFAVSNTAMLLATTAGVVVLVHIGVGQRPAPLLSAAVAVPLSFLITRLVLAGGHPRWPPWRGRARPRHVSGRGARVLRPRSR